MKAKIGDKIKLGGIISTVSYIYEIRGTKMYVIDGGYGDFNADLCTPLCHQCEADAIGVCYKCDELICNECTYSIMQVDSPDIQPCINCKL